MVEKAKTAKKSGAKDPVGSQEYSDSRDREAELLDRETAEAEPDKRPIGFRLWNSAPEDGMGQRIQDARRQAGMTQKDLADRTKLLDKHGQGVSRGALSLYEIGKNSPPTKELRLLCEALKISPNSLIYGIEDPFDDYLDQARYSFTSGEGPRLYAHMVYRLLKLHHHHRMSIIKLMEGLLFAKNKKFEIDEGKYAEEEFLKMADELRAEIAKR